VWDACYRDEPRIGVGHTKKFKAVAVARFRFANVPIHRNVMHR
jgi:hypothetical protein